MKTTIEIWTIERLYELRDKINPKPPFQRGIAWGERQKYLLIDSILRGYDIPKIYLNVVVAGKYIHGFDYEVADGQQRLRAIREFREDGFPLGAASSEVNGENLSGLKFSELQVKYRQRFGRYKITVALLNSASHDELRSLFARLQMGVVLNPPELRNAISSVAGSVIELAALTHPFFAGAGIPEKRFRRQDYLCHALALTTYDNKEDLKAPLLKRFYEDNSTAYDEDLVKRTYEILDWLNALGDATKRLVRKKWSFVDVFDLLYRHFTSIKDQDSEKRLRGFAAAYAEFEGRRRANTKTPEDLLADPSDKQLYNYTVAFKTTPATKQNIAARRAALDHYLGQHL
jgi:hypothetical protein